MYSRLPIAVGIAALQVRAISAQRLVAAWAAPNRIGLPITNVSGKAVNIAIAFDGDGLAISNSLSIERLVDQLESYAKLVDFKVVEECQTPCHEAIRQDVSARLSPLSPEPAEA